MLPAQHVPSLTKYELLAAPYLTHDEHLESTLSSTLPVHTSSHLRRAQAPAG